MDGASPPTHTPPILQTTSIYHIQQSAKLSSPSAQPETCVLMCALTRSIIKEDSRGKGGWLGGPAKERDDDQVASTSPDVFSPPVSFPCIIIIIHQRPYPSHPCSHVSAEHVCAIMCSTKLDV